MSTSHNPASGRPIPTWHADAKCAYAQRPQNWDLPLSNRLSRAETVAHCASLCAGCPVIRECAQEALDVNDRAMVRAGVALPLNAGVRYTDGLARRMIDAIAGGASPILAIADAIDEGDDARLPAVPELFRLAYETGEVDHPLPYEAPRQAPRGDSDPGVPRG